MKNHWNNWFQINLLTKFLPKQRLEFGDSLIYGLGTVILMGKLCSILYNRGVYPEETFAKVKKYGLPMLLTQDEGVKTFIANLTPQLSGKFRLRKKKNCVWGDFFSASGYWFINEICLMLNHVKIGWNLGSYRGWCLWLWVRLQMRSWRGGTSALRLTMKSLRKGT